MFDKYITEIKEKPFIITFVIMAVIGCVAYSYHFQLLSSMDEETTMLGYIEYQSLPNWSRWIHGNPRYFAIILGDILGDSTIAKNMLLFLNLIASVAIVTFFTRLGMGVKSIFWSIIIGAPLFINPGMDEHYIFVVNIYRITPVFLLLPMISAMIVNQSWKNMLGSGVLLFLCLSNYQSSVFHYIGAIIILTMVAIIQKQDKPIKEIAIELIKNKIIPSLIVLIPTVIIYFKWTEYLLGGKKDKVFNILSFTMDAVYNMWHYLQQIIDFIIFNYYPANMHYGHRVFAFLILVLIVSIFLVFRKQQGLKKIILPITVILLLVVTSVAINVANIGSLTWGFWLLLLRTTEQNSLLISLMLYLAYVGLYKIPKIRVIAGTLAFIFVLQLCNQTVYKQYQQIVANQAKMARLNRLYNDIFKYARANHIRNKLKIFFIIKRYHYKTPKQPGIPESKHFLYHDQTAEYKERLNDNPIPFVYKLALENDIYIMSSREMLHPKVQKNCKNIVADKNSSKWPFYNSMKLIDGIIYVKLTDRKYAKICRESATYSNNKARIGNRND